MKYSRRFTLILGGWLMAEVSVWTHGQTISTTRWPEFQEVYGLIRSNLTGLGEADLNRAAVLGLLDQLRTQIALETNAPAPAGSPETPSLRKATVFDESYGYLSVRRVASDLAKTISEAHDQLRAKSKLKGLILDLRFASGSDYAAAAEAADLFFTTEQPLLKWNDAMARSKAKTNAINQPLVILVNRQTAGAAEALAAVLRQAEAGLVIGGPTAGQAHQFKEIPLSNGQRLRIASGSIQLGDGSVLSEKGLNPDIAIAVNPADEKIYFEDPFKVLPKFAGSGANRPSNDNSSAAGAARPPRRRPTESDLIRMRQDGSDLDADAVLPSGAPPSKPAIMDPGLARAIDFLKGLALVQSRR